jgi:hypothetical protein
MSETLAEALPREMARVRDEILPEYQKIPTGALAAAMMRQSLNAAAQAMASGDLARMIQSYNDLKGYSL